ncbi:MAG TPA: 16S rRNA (guanine(966)-N(2))-methyltransferase RsmD [Tepidisphaeraceae bacterium]|nr:16S rRNA (guanine(966)-N(2))-methyltransferase RsmD [Tepidisphaeraceae bacterium]
MRIIAGEFRGRKLLGPESDQTTRPITDRAKQSLFDVITPLLDGAVIYDCFCGTGSMGLESLSRGAKFSVFFDRDRSAIKRLGENIETLGVKDRSRVVAGDIFKWFERSKGPPAEAGLADLVFLDPPYRLVTEQSGAIQKLFASIQAHHLSVDGRIIFRHDTPELLVPDGFTRYDQRTYGNMTIDLLKRS